jgi:hypothetical protein
MGNKGWDDVNSPASIIWKHFYKFGGVRMVSKEGTNTLQVKSRHFILIPFLKWDDQILHSSSNKMIQTKNIYIDLETSRTMTPKQH